MQSFVLLLIFFYSEQVSGLPINFQDSPLDEPKSEIVGFNEIGYLRASSWIGGPALVKLRENYNVPKILLKWNPIISSSKSLGNPSTVSIYFPCLERMPPFKLNPKVLSSKKL